MAKQTVAIDLQATTKGAESVKSLKQQIREAQAEAIQLARKFGDFSPEATKAAQKVADLRDEMGDFQQRVAALNPDKFQAIAGITQGIAGGISAMAGAMALFGAESEETQKLMAKVQGAIAFSTGVQQLLDLKNSFGAVATMIKTNVVAAFTTLKGAMMATGIGLVITALAALVQHLESVQEEAENTKQKLDDLKDFYDRVWQLDEQDMQIAINRAKARGASEREILQIQLDANKRRVADLREQQKAGADVDNEILQQRKQAEILITAFEAQEAANRKAAKQKAYEKQLEAERKHQEEKEAQIQAELEKNATLLALQQNTLEEQIAAADAAFATQIADLKKRNYSEIEINKLRDAALEKVRKDYYDKKKVDDEKAAKEAEDFRNKANESLLRAQESYYTDLKTKLIQNNATQAKLDALEVQRLEANLTAMEALYGENSHEAIKATAELVAKKKELYDIDVKNKEEAEKALREAQLQTLSATASAISAMGALFKEGSDAAKAAALADIAINTGVGFVQGLDIAQKSAKATGPAAAFAFPIFYATQIAAVLGAASRARSILKVGGNDGGGNKPPAPPSFNAVPLTSGMLPENENAAGFAGMGRVYVLEGDITNTQRRVRRIKNVSVV